MDNLITIQNLLKSYKVKGKKPLVVFDNFNLEIDKSKHLICLTGPDGAGKSTLLKLLSGILKKDNGKLLLDNLSPSTSDLNFNQNIGYMSQTLGLYTELSVWDNLVLFSSLKGLDTKSNQSYLEELLAKVDLLRFKDREFGALSGGMKQKLGLICTIAAKPKILILDEPTVGVDPISRMDLWQVVNDYLKTHDCYCIFSTAYLEEAQKADLCLMLEDGKIKLMGKSEELISKVRDLTYTLKLSDDDYDTYLKDLMGLTARHHERSPMLDVCPRLGKIDILVKSTEDTDKVLPFLENALHIKAQIKKRTAILEDAYIYESLAHSQFVKDGNEDKPTDFDQDKEVVVVDKIKKTFGNFTAVESSSFKVHQGEIFGLLGPNGAGKTTTFRMICALLTPSEGQVTVNGYNLKKAKADARSCIGYVSQKFSLYRKLNVYQNLEYFGLSYGLKPQKLKTRIQELLEEFHLHKFEKTKSEDLPFGVQRQLSMACALIHKPKILFLDEATSGADPLARRLFWDRVVNLSKSGTCVIVTTHFMEEAEYCDNFLIQDRGKILVLGKPKDICRDEKTHERISIEKTFINKVEEFRQSLTKGGTNV